MFYLCLFVRLFVCLSGRLLKSYERILVKLFEGLGVPRETLEGDLSDDQDHDTDPGIF